MAGRNSGIKVFVLANLRASPVKSGVLFAGFVTLVFLLVRQFSGGAGDAEAALQDGDVVVVVAGAPGAADGEIRVVSAPVVRLPRPRVAGSMFRDPFALAWLGKPRVTLDDEPDVDEDLLEELTLEFTMTGDAKSDAMAMVSGIVVQRGNRLGRWIVVEIGERHVGLRDGTEVVTLKMR